MEKLKCSNKPVLRQLFSVCKDDVRTITGANLRNIMLQCGENSVDCLNPASASSIQYHQITEEDMWRINLLTEVIPMRHQDIDIIVGWTNEELDSIISFVCSS